MHFLENYNQQVFVPHTVSFILNREMQCKIQKPLELYVYTLGVHIFAGTNFSEFREFRDFCKT